jgi:hypothetical protein
VVKLLYFIGYGGFMKKILVILGFMLLTHGLFAQEYPRLIEVPKKQTPGSGQSVYAFTVSMRSERSVTISIDDVEIAHLFNGERAEIVVPNGKHIVRAYQLKWDKRSRGWKEDDDDRLTDTLNGVRYEVAVTSGPDLKGGRQTKLPTMQPEAGTSKPGIEEASAKASSLFIRELPKSSRIAVINISSRDTELATFAIDELEYQLVTAKKFTMVDRQTLDAIRAEQNFQMSGDVSDESAVAIGNMLGAGIVITGSISGSGNSQRLTLKALDVKTAQIITMAREAF